MPEETLEHYLQKPLVKYSDNTITAVKQLKANLAFIRQEGIDWSIDEFAEGFVGVSAPTFSPQGQVVAALNIFAPSFRFPKDNKAEMTTLLLETTQQISPKIQNLFP